MYLGIDTSSSVLCLGLWSKGGFRETLEVTVERDHTKRIIVELEALLKHHDINKNDLQGIGVGLGPGSYTGIRVGIATAKGLSQGLKIPVSGCSSLEAVAARCLKNGEKAIIALDARRHHFYYGVFEKKQDSLFLKSELGKATKASLETAYKNLNWYEDKMPDASYLAQKAALSPNSNLAALYL